MDTHKYDDIINLPNPTSKRHPRMSKEILSDEVIAGLNEKLRVIAENIGKGQMVTITYFMPDERKAGGAYVTHSGVVKRIDEYEHTVIMTDGAEIPIGQISEIESELFGNLYE